MRVLIVDDEVRMTAALARGLTAEGFTVDVVHEGRSALDALARTSYDAVVLDIMLPGLSGYGVLKELRGRGDSTPVLVLSAKDGDYDLADALDLGADDYLVKPFGLVVLVARLHALLRRGRDLVPAVLESGGIQLDPRTRVVLKDSAAVDLSPREYQLLEHLMRRSGAVVSKLDLLESVFGADPDTHPNLVEVYVSYLRRKLGKDAIVTVRGGGYRMSPG